jgi:hypothetical protein
MTTDEKLDYRRQLKSIEKINEAAERPDPRLSGYLKREERIQELHENIDKERSRFLKFLEKHDYLERTSLFKWEPRNFLERAGHGISGFFKNINNKLMSFSPFSKLQENLEEKTEKSWPWAAILLVFLLLAGVGLSLGAWQNGVFQSKSSQSEPVDEEEELVTNGDIPLSEEKQLELLKTDGVKQLLSNKGYASLVSTENGESKRAALQRHFLHEIYQLASLISKNNGYAAPGVTPAGNEKNPDLIHPGDILKLPNKEKKVVEKKETIWKISGVTYTRIANQILDGLKNSKSVKSLEALAVTKGLKKLLDQASSNDQTN